MQDETAYTNENNNNGSLQAQKSDIQALTSDNQKQVSYQDNLQQDFSHFIVVIHQASEVPSRDKKKTPDPFIRLYIDDTKVAKTRVIKSTQDPRWEQEFTFEIPQKFQNNYLKVSLCDASVPLKSQEQLGEVTIHLEEIIREIQERGMALQKWFLIGPPQNFKGKFLCNCKISISIQLHKEMPGKRQVRDQEQVVEVKSQKYKDYVLVSRIMGVDGIKPMTLGYGVYVESRVGFFMGRTERYKNYEDSIFVPGVDLIFNTYLDVDMEEAMCITDKKSQHQRRLQLKLAVEGQLDEIRFQLKRKFIYTKANHEALGYTYLPLNKIAMIDEMETYYDEQQDQGQEDSQSGEEGAVKLDKGLRERGSRVTFDDDVKKQFLSPNRRYSWRFQDADGDKDQEDGQQNDDKSMPNFKQSKVALDRQRTKFIDREDDHGDNQTESSDESEQQCKDKQAIQTPKSQPNSQRSLFTNQDNQDPEQSTTPHLSQKNIAQQDEGGQEQGKGQEKTQLSRRSLFSNEENEEYPDPERVFSPELLEEKINNPHAQQNAKPVEPSMQKYFFRQLQNKFRPTQQSQISKEDKGLKQTNKNSVASRSNKDLKISIDNKMDDFGLNTQLAKDLMKKQQSSRRDMRNSMAGNVSTSLGQAPLQSQVSDANQSQQGPYNVNKGTLDVSNNISDGAEYQANDQDSRVNGTTSEGNDYSRQDNIMSPDPYQQFSLRGDDDLTSRALEDDSALISRPQSQSNLGQNNNQSQYEQSKKILDPKSVSPVGVSIVGQHQHGDFRIPVYKLKMDGVKKPPQSSSDVYVFVAVAMINKSLLAGHDKSAASSDNGLGHKSLQGDGANLSQDKIPETITEQDGADIEVVDKFESKEPYPIIMADEECNFDFRMVRKLMVDECEDSDNYFKQYWATRELEDIVRTKWEKKEDGLKHRMLDFNQPLNVPFMPRMTPLIEESILLKNTTKGFTVHYKSQLPKIPAGNCFQVWITLNVYETGSNKCRYNQSAFVEFYKNSVLKDKIYASINQQMVANGKDMYRMLIDYVNKMQRREGKPEVAVDDKAKDQAGAASQVQSKAQETKDQRKNKEDLVSQILGFFTDGFSKIMSGQIGANSLILYSVLGLLLVCMVMYIQKMSSDISSSKLMLQEIQSKNKQIDFLLDLVAKVHNGQIDTNQVSPLKAQESIQQIRR